MQTQIYRDSTELSRAAAGRITEIAREAFGARGRFTIALAGGSTPKETYGRLAQAPYAGEIDWPRTFVFLSDERCVPPGDARSNFGMAQAALLSHIPLPPENIFPLPTDAGTPDAQASQYARTIAEFFGLSDTDAPPAFDLILLGLGDDGHTASLFPGHPALEEGSRWVVSSPPGTLPPPVERVTFTFPLLNAARHVLFLVGGENKADAVRDVLQGGASVQSRPAAGVQPAPGQLTWMLDTGAAHLLKR